MASCLACEAKIGTAGVEVGETLICDECGAEHEVLRAKPLELALLDDEPEETGSPSVMDDEDEGDEDDDYDEDDEDEMKAGPSPIRGALLTRAG